MSPTLRDHLFEKLVLGLVSCTLVRSQMYELLNQREYPLPRGGTTARPSNRIARYAELIERYALCNGRELSINLQCQTNNESTLVPGNLTRVKQRGAAAGYGNSEEVTGVRPCEGFLICSLLKSERRFEDGVLTQSEHALLSLNFPPTHPT